MITLYQNDFPSHLTWGTSVAIDCEMMGLQPTRDRLCLVQLSTGDGNAHLVQIERDVRTAPNLAKLLAHPDIVKIFHFARKDVAVLKHHLGVLTAPLYCTKIASRLARTYTDHHSLKTLCKEILGVELEKQQQTTDWGQATLTPEQMAYAASDVLHLHKLKDALDKLLEREGRMPLAQSCFDFLPARALLDLHGGEEWDLFAHH